MNTIDRLTGKSRNRSLRICLISAFLAAGPCICAQAQMRYYGAGEGNAQGAQSDVEVNGVDMTQPKADQTLPPVMREHHKGEREIHHGRLPKSSAPRKKGEDENASERHIFRISSDDCSEFQKYQPVPSTDYHSGQQSGPGAIVPADISPAPAAGNLNDLKFTFNVRLYRPLSKNSNVSGEASPNITTSPVAGPEGDLLGEASVARVEFRNGVVSLNGTPISNSDADVIAQACADQVKARRPAEERPENWERTKHPKSVSGEIHPAPAGKGGKLE